MKGGFNSIAKQVGEKMYKVFASCFCHTGKVRNNNEDNFYFNGSILPNNSNGTSSSLCCTKTLKQPVCFSVFDGMGGEECGQEAAFLAALTFQKYAPTIELLPDDLLRIFEKANQRICNFTLNNDLSVSGSTVAAICFHMGFACIANIGDSKIYLIRNHGLTQLSVDHTDKVLLDQKGITKRKPQLTQHLGIPSSEMIIEPYTETIKLQSADRFLLCSDGLSDMVPITKIQEIVSRLLSPTEVVQLLTEIAMQNGGRDNITIILCDISK